MGRSVFVCLLLAWMTVDEVRADTCLPNFLSVDTIENVQIGTARKFSHPLKSKNASGLFVTRAVLEGEFDGQRLDLTVRFPSNGVSLPYNIYLLAAGTDKGALAWEDLTEACTGPGKSIFPGQFFKLRSIKLERDAGDVSLHLILWGRI